ncbi:MAG: hypothetical protein M0Z52_10550 [Actinomycetota bacterium]|nr:hypothetical protein [Actinomycetota bacterium]
MDHPGVRCENCKDIEQVDGILAPCRTPSNCPVPALSQEAARLLEMRQMMVSLKGLANPEAILKMYGATAGDLKMLARVEDMLNLKGTEDK